MQLDRLTTLLLASFLVTHPIWSSGIAEAGPTDFSTLAGTRGERAPESPSAISSYSDPFTGAATHALPIEVPPGTGGLTPVLALRYSSGARSDSWTGYGWSLGTSSVTRSLHEGVPTYDDDEDVFLLDGQRLVSVGQEQQGNLVRTLYRTRRESFLRIVHEVDTVGEVDTWVVTRKNGIRLRFGNTPESRVERVDGGVFQWFVTEETDLNHNAIEYRYVSALDPGTVYPSEIRYGLREVDGSLESLGGNPAADRSIRFVLESSERPDVAVDHAAGLPRELRSRLDHLEVGIGSGSEFSILRRYDFRYVQSPDSFRSLLSEVALSGSDALDTNPTPPRVTSFSYHSNVEAGTTGWETAPWTWPPGAFGFVGDELEDAGVRLGDANGDGLIDLIKSFSINFQDGSPITLSGDSGVYLNSGAGFTTAREPSFHPLPTIPSTIPGVPDVPLAFATRFPNQNGLTWGNGTTVLDLTGDGRVDVVGAVGFTTPLWDPQTTPLEQAIQAPWCRSTGSRFECLSQFPAEYYLDGTFYTAKQARVPTDSLSAFGYLGGNTQFGDLTGDGLADLVVRGRDEYWALYGASPCQAASTMSYVAYNRGNLAFEQAPLSSAPPPSLGCSTELAFVSEAFQICDLALDPGCARRALHAETKHSILFDYTQPPLFHYIGAFGHRDMGSIVADLNADGLADSLTAAFYVGESQTFGAASLNDGNLGFRDADSWRLPDAAALRELTPDPTYPDADALVSTDRGIRFADVNGDGRLDAVRAREGDLHQTWLNDADANEDVAPSPWVAAPLWTLPPELDFVTESGQDLGLRLVDLDGDGMVDIARSRGTLREVYMNRGSVPDLLVGMTNAMGGAIEITYVSSARFDHTGDDDVPDLPRSLQVVETLLTDDANGTRSMVAFAYEGGRFVVEESELRGFRTVTATRDDGRRTITRYHQDDARVGLVESREVRDAQGATWSSEEYRYTDDDDGLAPYISLPATRTLIEHDGSGAAAPRRSLVRFEYDAGGPITTGNVTSTVELGAVSDQDLDLVPGDSRVVELLYAPPNEALHLLDRVAVVRLRQGGASGAGEVIRETRQFYDGDTTGLAVPTRGNLTMQVAVLNDPVLADPTTTHGYDDVGNRVWTTNPRGNAGSVGTSTVEYDPLHRSFPVAVVNALGHRTEFEYGAPAECALQHPAGAGLVHVERRPNALRSGEERVRCYDAFGRIALDRAPGGLGETRWVYYDTPGTVAVTEVRRATDFGGTLETSTLFDGFGRETGTIRSGPQGRVILSNRTYDSVGRLASESAPYFVGEPPATTTFAYDPLDRVVQTQLPGAGRIHSVVHENGLITLTDANGNARQRLVDPFGNLVEVREVTEDGVLTTHFDFDVTGQIVGIVDHLGNETRLAYDRLGRKVFVDDPDRGQLEFGYDANGNRVRQSGPLGETTWTYDALDRPTSQTRSDRSEPDVRWLYDSAANGIGRLAARVDDAGTYQVQAFDLLGRVAGERQVEGVRVHAFTNAYDPLGQIARRTYPSGQTLELKRDARGFLEAISVAGDAVFASAIEWDASGRNSAWTAGSGVRTEVEFDLATTRLDRIRVEGTGLLEHLAYRFDAGDRLETVDDLRDTVGNRGFGYDELDRLVSATGPYVAGSVTPRTLLYGYDPIGNLSCRGAQSLPGCDGGVEYIHPPPGSPHPHSPRIVGGQSLGIDGAGNLTRLGDRDYTYDSLGRMVGVAEGGVTRMSFSYDGAGRLAKTEEHSGGESIERLLLASDFEWNRTEGVALTSIRLAGATIATVESAYSPPMARCGGGSGVHPLGARSSFSAELLVAGLLSLWLYAGIRRRPPVYDRLAIAAGTTGVLVVAIGSTVWIGAPGQEAYADSFDAVSYYHGDHLGSSVVVTDETGGVVQRAIYLPYGGIVTTTPAGSQDAPRHGFAGQRYFAPLEVYRYGARWYDPGLGRFLQPDSLIPQPSDPQSLNPYAYARNNPLNRIDPSGNFDFRGLFGGVVSVIGDSLLRPLAGLGSGFGRGLAFSLGFASAPDSSGFFFDQGVGLGSLLGAGVGLGLDAVATSLSVAGNLLGLGASDVSRPSAGGSLSSHAQGILTRVDQLSRDHRSLAGVLARDDLAALGTGLLGSALGLSRGIGNLLEGSFSLNQGTFVAGFSQLTQALVPRFGRFAGPGYGRFPLVGFSNPIDMNSRVHDLDYGDPAVTTSQADRKLADSLRHSFVEQPLVGPSAQAYRAGELLLFEFKARYESARGN